VKSRSAKNKGVRLQNEVKAAIKLRWPELIEGQDYRSALMGESGVDIHLLSPNARQKIKSSIECKYQETSSIWAWMQQAQENADSESNKWGVDLPPLLIFRRNRGQTYVCTYLENYLDLLKIKESI
jgi:hypothetical protein